MKTVLGPRSYDKLIVDLDEYIISNDGATVLYRMLRQQNANPAQLMLMQLSRSMDQSCGDGTTSVVVLTGSLLNEAKRILQMRETSSASALVSALVRGYSWAMERARIPIEQHCVQNLDKQLLLKIASTVLNSKISSYLAPELASVAVDALLNAAGARRDHVQVVTMSSSSVDRMVSLLNTSTDLDDGTSCAVLDVKRGETSRMLLANPLQRSNANIAVLTFSLSRPHVVGHEHQIVVPTTQELDRILKEEESYVKNIVNVLKKHKIDIVFVLEDHIHSSGGGISNAAKHWLQKTNILAIGDLEMAQLEMVCSVTGARPISSFEQLTREGPQRMAVRVSTVRTLATTDMLANTALYSQHGSDLNSGKCFLVIENRQTKEKRRSCVILRSNMESSVLELERALNDVLVTMEPIIRSLEKNESDDIISTGVVPGGGTCEMAASAHICRLLSSEGQSLSALEVLCVNAFCRALQEIPRVLCCQATEGSVSLVDATEPSIDSTHHPVGVFSIMKQLESLHQQDEHCNMGIFVSSASQLEGKEPVISDMVRAGVLEPARNKLSQITMATQMAIQILKIDAKYTIRQQPVFDNFDSGVEARTIHRAHAFKL